MAASISPNQINLESVNIYHFIPSTSLYYSEKKHFLIISQTSPNDAYFQAHLEAQ